MIRLLPRLVPLLLAAWVFRRALWDGAPMGVDNPVHFFRAELFWERLWETGRLAGWTSDWAFGYPADDLYSPGTVLWVAGWRLLTANLLDPERLFGLAVFAAWVVQLDALFVVARRFLGTPAALIGTLLWAIDPGGPKVGGYYYVVHAGVWGQSIALGFFLYGWEAMERDRDRLAGAWWAAALLCHLATLPMVAVLAVVRWGAWRPALWMCGLAAFWLVPFLDRRAWVNNIGDPGESLRTMVVGLFTGTPVFTGFAAAGPAALLGFALRRPWAYAWFGAMMIWLASWDAYAVVLSRFGDVFSNLQYGRFIQPAKCVVFPLAGAGIVSLAGALRRPIARIPAALLLGVVVLAIGKDTLTLHRLSGTLTTNLGEGWQRLKRVGNELAARDDGRFARVATDMGEANFLWAALPAFAGMGVYPIAYTPAKAFYAFPALPHPEAWRRASVRFVLRPGPEGIEVEELASWTPRRWEARGATVVEERFDDEEMRFRVSDATPSASLLLHVADYARWSATLDGAPLPHRQVPPAPGFDPILLEVPVRDGLLSVAWVTLPADYAGAALSLATLLATLRRRRIAP